MTRKHFQAIAEIIKNADSLDEQGRAEMVREFASLCRSVNPRFDRERFAAACQPE